MSNSNKLYLFDGNIFLFRAYFGLPRLLRSDGVPVGAILGLSNILFNQILVSDCSAWGVAFDAFAPTFRKVLYPPYKQNRSDPPEDLVPQFALARKAVTAFGIPMLEQEGWEADDLIATYAEEGVKKGYSVRIFSSDKDLLQLLKEGIEIFDPLKKHLLDAEYTLKKFGVHPNQMIDFQSLAGDSSDNVPGIPGIGPKTAAGLLGQFKTLDGILDNADNVQQKSIRNKLKEHKEKALISKKLVTLATDVDTALPFEALTRTITDHNLLLTFFKEMEFFQLAKRLESKMKSSGKLDGNIDFSEPKVATSGLLFEEDKKDGKTSETNRESSALKQDQEQTKSEDQDLKAELLPLEVEAIKKITSPNQLADWLNSAQPNKIAIVAEIPIDLLRIDAKPEAVAIAVDGGNEIAFIGFELLQNKQSVQEVADILQVWCKKTEVAKITSQVYEITAWLTNIGINKLASFDDVILMNAVINAGIAKQELPDLTKMHLLKEIPNREFFLKKGSPRISFLELDEDQQMLMLATNAKAVLKLYTKLKSQLIGNSVLSVYAHIDRPLIKLLRKIERQGIKVDREHLLDSKNIFQEKMQNYEKAIFAKAGRDFLIASPKQLGEVLFDEMKIDSKTKTASGKRSTGHETLEALHHAGHDIAGDILEWRKYQKLIATYCDNILALTENRDRIHTEFFIAGAQTGRLSSKNPNLQNIPIRGEDGRVIRKAFIPEDGNLFISLDYSQIELRVLAAIADVPELQAALADGEDIHQSTADAIFGKDGDRKEKRSKAKAINFGIIYGISAYGLAKQLSIRISEAQEIINQYFNRFSGIKSYMENCKIQASRKGYVETLFARRIHLPNINSYIRGLREFAERQAINAPIQGSAADIVKIAMQRVYQLIKSKNYKSKIILQIHDELLLESPIQEAEEIQEKVKEIMINAYHPMSDKSIKLEVKHGSAKNWAEAS